MKERCNIFLILLSFFFFFFKHSCLQAASQWGHVSPCSYIKWLTVIWQWWNKVNLAVPSDYRAALICQIYQFSTVTQFIYFSFYDLTNLDKSQSEPLTGFKDNYESYIAIARLPADGCSQIYQNWLMNFLLINSMIISTLNIKLIFDCNVSFTICEVCLKSKVWLVPAAACQADQREGESNTHMQPVTSHCLTFSVHIQVP